MSSFIVEDKTINRIVNFCFWEHGCFLKENIKSELGKIGIDLHKYTTYEDEDKLLQLFGEELLKLNLMAFYDRYKDTQDIRQEIKDAVAEYKYRETELKDRGHIQVLKSIECFLYQCSEGDIPNEPLFKALKNIVGHLRNTIINDMPEYEKAIWG